MLLPNLDPQIVFPQIFVITYTKTMFFYSYTERPNLKPYETKHKLYFYVFNSDDFRNDKVKKS